MRKQNFISDFFQRIFTFILLAGVLCAALPLAAQTRRAARTKKISAPKQDAEQPAGSNQKTACTGGWSGIVTYQKTLNYSLNGGKKDTNMGERESRQTDEYRYTGRIVVDGSKDAKVPVTKAQLILRDTILGWARTEKTQDCANDQIYKPQLQWWESNESDVTNAFHEGEAESFNLSLNEAAGTYSFSFWFPKAKGSREMTTKTTQGGWCREEWNKPESRSETLPAEVDGEGAEIKSQKIDSERPDVLSGSKTWTEGSTPSTTYNITVKWSFKRCPAPVEVTAIRFDEHPYPDPDAWHEFEHARGTTDGNKVRIRATVTNFSGDTRFPKIKFSEMVEKWVLPDGETSVRLEAGESREVSLEWDTSGYAWKGTGFVAGSRTVAPQTVRKIKVEAEDEGRISELIEQVLVVPRPVLLVHGFLTDKRIWDGYDEYFAEGHSAAWQSFVFDPNGSRKGRIETFGYANGTKTISESAKELHKQIESIRKDMSAWHINIVAHSVGGLIARQYIHGLMPPNPQTRKPAVTHLIMLGTPNAGTPCAALMEPAFSATGSNVEALRELIPENMEKFNARITRRHGVRFYAGVGRAVQNTCQTPTLFGDGMVTAASAAFNIYDWHYSDSMTHMDLTSRSDFYRFVLGRLATGPRGNHDPDLLNDDYNPDGSEKASNLPRDFSSRTANGDDFNSYFRKASYNREIVRDADDKAAADGADIEGLILAEQVKLAPNQSTEIEIPMKEGARAAVVFMAPPTVSATLIDSAGSVVGRNTAGTAESRQPFRTIAVEKRVTNGKWKLKLENGETTATEVLLAAFSDPNPLVFSIVAGKPTAAKQASLQAKLTMNGAAVPGAVVKAKIESANGQGSEIVLLDDGSHNDGAAGDGIYGATTGKLGDGDYLVEAKAETNGQIRLAAASFTVGAETAPVAKPISKISKK